MVWPLASRKLQAILLAGQPGAGVEGLTSSLGGNGLEFCSVFLCVLLTPLIPSTALYLILCVLASDCVQQACLEQDKF